MAEGQNIANEGRVWIFHKYCFQAYVLENFKDSDATKTWSPLKMNVHIMEFILIEIQDQWVMVYLSYRGLKP